MDVDLGSKTPDDGQTQGATSDRGGQTPLVYACKCTGISHKQENKPCQDAYAVWQEPILDNPVIILAVADGHGSKKYDLSQIGSEIAVDTVIDELMNFYSSYLDSKEKSAQEFNISRMLKADFPQRIIRRWKEAVLNHYMINYEKEIDEQQKRSVIKRFGTTVLFAMAVAEGVFVGQLGDGDMLIVNEDRVERPLPTSAELLGNETFSTTSENAHLLWNIKNISLESKSMLMLSTDGLANSYADDAFFERFAKSLFDNVKNYREIEEVIQLNLEHFIENISEKGSGDDITIAFAILDPLIFKG
ncbi:MAG: PP2C family serine/threonine-protein phosphatase [Desulfitobacteriaceae bacterium]